MVSSFLECSQSRGRRTGGKEHVDAHPRGRGGDRPLSGVREERAGHAVFVDQPERFNAALGEFLKTLAGGE
jgi:pimeloyl-ACP methyl ester carboxylesterase